MQANDQTILGDLHVWTTKQDRSAQSSIMTATARMRKLGYGRYSAALPAHRYSAALPAQLAVCMQCTMF
jgi:hypothetical protein